MTVSDTPILPDKFGDWRLESVHMVKGDQVLPGGPVKDGTLFWKSTWISERTHGTVIFATPHPVALSLSVALNAALQARLLKGDVVFPKKMVGGGRGAGGEHVSTLFGYFEQCMVTVIFAYQALELFANYCIAEKAEHPIMVIRDKKPKQYRPDELERKLSTEDKFLKVLPQIYSKKLDPSSGQAKDLRHLKEVRDATVHLKSRDHYVRGKIDDESVYHRFLNNDPLAYVQTSIRIMRHFVEPEKVRWLDAACDYTRSISSAAREP